MISKKQHAVTAFREPVREPFSIKKWSGVSHTGLGPASKKSGSWAFVGRILESPEPAFKELEI
ncbi:MAG: hypothetical protein GY757_40135 [bacterium]|nr:hypothetical protein [bacterium]